MVTARLIALTFLAVLCMCIVPVLIKGNSANEVTIAIARLLIASLIMWPLVFRERNVMRSMRESWPYLVAIGFFFAAHWLTYFASIKLATAAIAALAISTYGMQYLLLAWLINGEKVTWLEIAAVAACLGGCVIVAPELTLQNDITRGVLIGFFSAFLYACLPFFHQRSTQCSNNVRSFAQFSIALLFVLPFYAYSEWQLSHQDYLGLLVLGIVCTVVAHGLWVKVTTELPAIYPSMIYYLYVPIAMFTSALFLDEAITLQKLVGAALVLGASTTVTYFRFRNSAPAP